MSSFLPSDHQLPFSVENHIQITDGVLDDNSLPLDVLFIGAGPASLSSAIHLADLMKAQNKEIEIGIIEKADELGGHTLSGAVINPMVFKWIFPNKKESDFPFKKRVQGEKFYFLTKNYSIPLPIPPGMKNKKYYSASLCEVVRWLGKEAEQRGVHIFTSHPADKLLVKDSQIVGVCSTPFGLQKDGSKMDSYTDPVKVFAKTIVLSEGSRGHLTQAFLHKENIKSRYPQTYALGVKEIWEVKKEPKKIMHTISWPLEHSTFGGSWLYPLGNNLVSLGLIAGLDSTNSQLSVHDKLQQLKEHPILASLLQDGKCIEWGAKTLPEGGYHALPERLHGDRVLVIGDSAGFINMASLKGIHYAMASGFFAAKTLKKAFDKQDFSKQILKKYDEQIKNSFIIKDLKKSRNLRQSFHKGIFSGLLRSTLIVLTAGKWPRDFKEGELKEDALIERYRNSESAQHKGLNKLDAVFLSGNKTRDQIPSHLDVKENVPKEVALFYQQLCPAGVYEYKNETLIVNAPNCIDCKATDVLGPRWKPKERGSGPHYKLM